MQQSTFDETAFPIETRLRAAEELYRFHMARADAAEKRRIPPERKEYEELERKYRLLEQQHRDLDKMYKENRDFLLARIAEYQADDCVARLECDRDQWRDRWRRAVERIAALIEHQGNVELLEYELRLASRRPSKDR